jgi:putative GTP pyrophosphokinase
MARISPWRICTYSRKEVDRAGSTLRDESVQDNVSRYIDAYGVMDSWRASHAFPLNTMQMTLRRRASQIDADSEVVQRLKRAPSVISKLRRFRDMQLSRMQDLGGCRAILKGVREVELLRDAYKASRDRHELVTEKDYILQPQDSGYRGVHLIYRYASDKSQQYNGHRIEIQLRTRVQHAWATAVEIAGIYVRRPLKSSIGPEKWLDFFKYASSAFAYAEKSPRLHSRLERAEIIDLLRDCDRSIEARKKLSSLTGAHQYLVENRRKSDSHFILLLNLEERKTTIESFNSVATASRRYADLEKRFIADDLIDVVLVAAENVESVTQAYPNYFADTRQFVRIMNRLIG